jgi:hypothetical protein
MQGAADGHPLHRRSYHAMGLNFRKFRLPNVNRLRLHQAVDALAADLTGDPSFFDDKPRKGSERS